MEINKNGTSSVICMMFFWLPELHKLSCSFNEPWKDGVEDGRTIGSRDESTFEWVNTDTQSADPHYWLCHRTTLRTDSRITPTDPVYGLLLK